MLEGYIGKFVVKNKDSAKTLKSLLDGGDIPAAIILVHSIKGNAGYMSAKNLYTVALKLEQELRSNEPLDSLEIFYKELSVAIDAIEAGLPRRNEEETVKKIASVQDKIAGVKILDEVYEIVHAHSFVNDEMLSELKSKLSAFVNDSDYKRLIGAIDNFDTPKAIESIEVLRRQLQL
jgi:HPt (histidine-containing phosphotransfer) domain-containing protein